MGYIGIPPKQHFTSGLLDRFTSTTGTTVTLSKDISSENDIIVFVNFVKQDSTNYSVGGAGNKTLTLGGTLVSSDIVEVHYLNIVGETNAPADNSVSQSKLVDDIVNEAKLQVSNSPTNGYMLTAQSGNTGGLTWAEGSSGKVLQVVTATTTSAVTNTGGSSATSGLSASITPASSANKVLVMSASSISTYGDGSSSSGRVAQVILYRGTTSGTNIREIWVGHNMVSSTTSTNANPRNEVSCIVLDEPSTTSAQTYTVAIAGSGACDITAQADSNRSNIVLMEIAG